MGKYKDDVTILTIEAGCGAVTNNFLTKMSNSVWFSRCECPHKPITEVRTEVITVERRQNILTVAALGANQRRKPKIYSMLTVELSEFLVFAILSHLPTDTVDDAFFPATGSLVLFMSDTGPRRLRATGMDSNSGQCRGWMFDAIEA